LEKIKSPQMKKILMLLMILGIINLAEAQVPRKIVVEHFTNTFCSVCASRNPGFFSNLETQKDVLQLSIHPSSPYSQCYFNRQNKSENDARTQYLGVFGSTPRLVINGVPLSASTNYSSPSIFDAYKSQTSDVSITVKGKYVGDSLEVETVIKAVVNNSLGNANLFVALANARVNYAAGNGEQLHHNVFRKSMYNPSGFSVTIPAMAGDSLVLISKVKTETIWGTNDLFALAILNNTSNKNLIQAEQSAIISLASGLEVISASRFKLYPNPVEDFLQFEHEQYLWQNYKVYTLQGGLVLSGNLDSQVGITVSGLNQGIYILELTNEQYVFRGKFIKQ
jgi:FlaG/FlaF family flagellin (archaellin)